MLLNYFIAFCRFELCSHLASHYAEHFADATLPSFQEVLLAAEDLVGTGRLYLSVLPPEQGSGSDSGSSPRPAVSGPPVQGKAASSSKGFIGPGAVKPQPFAALEAHTAGKEPSVAPAPSSTDRAFNHPTVHLPPPTAEAEVSAEAEASSSSAAAAAAATPSNVGVDGPGMMAELLKEGQSSDTAQDASETEIKTRPTWLFEQHRRLKGFYQLKYRNRKLCPR